MAGPILTHMAATDPKAASKVVGTLGLSRPAQVVRLLAGMTTQDARAILLVGAQGGYHSGLARILVAMAPVVAGSILTHMAATDHKAASMVVGYLGSHYTPHTVVALLAGMTPQEVGNLLVAAQPSYPDCVSPILAAMEAESAAEVQALYPQLQ